MVDTQCGGCQARFGRCPVDCLDGMTVIAMTLGDAQASVLLLCQLRCGQRLQDPVRSSEVSCRSLGRQYTVLAMICWTTCLHCCYASSYGACNGCGSSEQTPFRGDGLTRCMPDKRYGILLQSGLVIGVGDCWGTFAFFFQTTPTIAPATVR